MAPEPTEAQRARDTSRAFMLAAQRCNEMRPLPSGRFEMLMVPSLVCYAFCVEVGIKALALHAQGKGPWGHDLAKLFGSLPHELQTQIRNDTSAPYPGSDSRFDADLGMVRDTFDVWRYIHEKGVTETDLGFLQRLAVAVQKALVGIP